MIRTAIAFVIVLGTAMVLRAQTTQPAPVLPDRPDVARNNAAGEGDLASPFESLASGISFRPPAGWKEVRHRGGSEVVQYLDEANRRSLVVNRLAFDPPVEMTMHKVFNPDGTPKRDENGLFEETIDRLKADTPGIQIDRQDVVQMPTPDGWTMDVGLLAGRYKVGTDNNIVMLALLRASPPDKRTASASRVYYSFNLNAVIDKDLKPEELAENPRVRELAGMFNRVLETVKLLDQSPIRDEQNRRLFATRSLFVNLTPERVTKALQKEQWLRLIRDGKDIGYSYVVEETARDLPRGAQIDAQSSGPEGVLIGVRTRSIPGSGLQVDAESWMWSSFDRKFEKWTNFSLLKNPAKPEVDDRLSEIGSVNTQVKLVRERVGSKELAPGERFGRGRDQVDPNQPAMRQAEISTLEVFSKGKARGGPQQITRQLAPWYLPQAMGHLLPRLAAGPVPKQYMFAVFNSDEHELIHRYVDVDLETSVELGGRTVRAIPVRDRIGLEGSTTTHYVSPQGKYLGSVNKDSNITILPTDRATLESMWKNADLSRPAAVRDKQ